MSVDILGNGIAGSPIRSLTGPGLPVSAPSPVEKIRAFEEAIDSAYTRDVAPVKFAQSVNPAIASDAVAPLPGSSVSGLSGPKNEVDEARPGDAILSGLGRMRSVFSKQEAGLANTMASTSASVESMLHLQMNMVQYSLLIDVASKITGKLTQSVDSLVKGQ